MGFFPRIHEAPCDNHPSPPPCDNHNPPPPPCNSSPPCDNHTSPPPSCDAGHSSEHIGTAIAAQASLGVGEALTAHVNAHVGDAVSAHVAANLCEPAHPAAHGCHEYPSDCSTAIAAHVDLGLELGSCDHSGAHNLVTANLDAHLGDLMHDHAHVTIA